MTGFFDLQDPFFKPLWLRLLVVAICLGWAIFEALTGSTTWAVVFATAGLWSAYQFFVVWSPKNEDTDKGDKC
jgi:hypothetical protein